MLVQFDCFKCILNQCADMSGQSAPDRDGQVRMLKQYLAKVLEKIDDSTPPEVAEGLFEIFRRETGITDPYGKVKNSSTELAVKLLPEFAAETAKSSDPFTLALCFAIGGNVIDYGVNPGFDLNSAAGLIREAAQMPLDMSAVDILRERLQNSRKVLYILDNCGEAVFDRLLIDQIGAHKITLGVRGKAILNDVTRKELAMSGLGDLPVIDTGSATPGVSLKMSSPEFIQAVHQADTVIAKGQGNFESLYGIDGFDNVFFLFRVKCPVLVKFAGVPLNSLQVKLNQKLK